jgi:hypothetical protein
MENSSKSKRRLDSFGSTNWTKRQGGKPNLYSALSVRQNSKRWATYCTTCRSTLQKSRMCVVCAGFASEMHQIKRDTRHLTTVEDTLNKRRQTWTQKAKFSRWPRYKKTFKRYGSWKNNELPAKELFIMLSTLWDQVSVLILSPS